MMYKMQLISSYEPLDHTMQYFDYMVYPLAWKIVYYSEGMLLEYH